MAKKPELVESEQAAVPAEPAAEAPEVKKPKTAKKEKKSKTPEGAAETPPKKTAKKPARPATKKAVGRKPGRKPVKKTAALVPATARKKPGPKGKGLVGKKADLLRMGEGAFLYSLDLQRQIEEMERVIANYERVFEAVRVLFSREMVEIEELVAGLLE